MSRKTLYLVDEARHMRPLLRSSELPPMSGTARRRRQLEKRSRREVRRLERRARRAAQKTSDPIEASALERTIN